MNKFLMSWVMKLNMNQGFQSKFVRVLWWTQYGAQLAANQNFFYEVRAANGRHIC